MTRSPQQIQKAVIFALMLRELKTRFGGRLIGLFWVLFEPLANIAALLAIRVVLRERTVGVQIEPEVFLVVAMIPFFLLRNIWFRMMEAVDGNSGLFAYRQVKPFDAMVARALIECALYATLYVILMLFFAWLGDRVIPHRPLEYMGVVLLFIVWGVALGMVSTIVAHNRPPVRTFLRLLSFPLYLLSGVLIPLSRFPATMHEYLLWNPLLHVVELSRWAFFPTYHAFNGTNLAYPLSLGLVLLVVGMVMYRINRLKLLART